MPPHVCHQPSWHGQAPHFALALLSRGSAPGRAPSPPPHASCGSHSDSSWVHFSTNEEDSYKLVREIQPEIAQESVEGGLGEDEELVRASGRGGGGREICHFVKTSRPHSCQEGAKERRRGGRWGKRGRQKEREGQQGESF